VAEVLLLKSEIRTYLSSMMVNEFSRIKRKFNAERKRRNVAREELTNVMNGTMAIARCRSFRDDAG
jgi:hypothetical protein